jgi:hypothetical protein
MLPRSLARCVALLALSAVVAGCGLVSTTPPAPTPADFQGIAAELVQHGIHIDHLVSGDAGCDDRTLAQTAIGLDAVGLDQAEAVRLRVFIFRNRASYEKLRSTIDDCARAWVTDPDTFESVETSPFVVAGQGPWGPEFRAAVRAAITAAAGTGN